MKSNFLPSLSITRTNVNLKLIQLLRKVNHQATGKGNRCRRYQHTGREGALLKDVEGGAMMIRSWDGPRFFLGKARMETLF